MCQTLELMKCRRRVKSLEQQLGLVIPPEYGAIGINYMSSILLDEVEEMGDDRADIHLPDRECKVYRKQDVKDFLALEETDKITFESEVMDCDDFAALLFGKFLGLVWTTKHALNWFIDENDTLWFVEPQTDKLSQTLGNWQGWDIRFFIGR